MQTTATKKSGASWAPIVISAIAVAAMCVFIFYMSARPGDESDALSLDFVWHIVGFIVPGYDQMSVADQLYWQQTLNYPVRKLAHFTEYAVLGALTLNLLVQIERRQIVPETSADDTLAFTADALAHDVKPSSTHQSRPKTPAPISALAPHIKHVCAAAWALATAYAATDEFHQIFVPGRTCKLTDVLIDSAGILFGILIVALVLHLLAKRASRNAGAKSGEGEGRPTTPNPN